MQKRQWGVLLVQPPVPTGVPPRRAKGANLILGGVGLFLAATVAGTAVGYLNAELSEASPPGHTGPTSVLQPTSPSPTQTDGPLPASPTEQTHRPLAPTPTESSDSPVPTVSVPAPPPRTTTTEPPPGPTKAELEEAAAFQALKRQALSDRSAIRLHGQWAAQLSSKYVGVYDARQQTASGSHTFEAVDILAEHEQLRSIFESQYEVRLLRGQDFGSGKTHHGHTFWYTFVLGNFTSQPDVEYFCQLAFPGRSGQDLNNHCLPRKLTS